MSSHRTERPRPSKTKRAVVLGLKRPSSPCRGVECSPTCRPPAPKPSRDPASPNTGGELAPDFRKINPSLPASRWGQASNWEENTRAGEARRIRKDGGESRDGKEGPQLAVQPGSAPTTPWPWRRRGGPAGLSPRAWDHRGASGTGLLQQRQAGDGSWGQGVEGRGQGSEGRGRGRGGREQGRGSGGRDRRAGAGGRDRRAGGGGWGAGIGGQGVGQGAGRGC